MPRRRESEDSRARKACDSVEKRNELPSMSSHSVDSDRTTMVIEDEAPEPAPNAEVVVKGRNVEVPEHFRIYVSEKLSRLERFDRTIYLFDVELDHERNRRQRKNCQHVEITARGRGPVVRGEACADSFYADGAAVEDHEPGRIVRTKDHPAKPMTVDDALYEMELVGHDFFLFHDKQSDKPCVVYRRHAYDYGLIRLA